MSLAIVIFWGLTFLTFGIGGLALWKGGPAERTGSAVILLIMLAGRLIGTVVPEHILPILRLAEDGLTAVGLLVVALRYASLWIGGAMLLYAGLFTLHSAYFVLDKSVDPFFKTCNNLAFLGVSICLAVGTFVSWRQRSRKRAAEA